METKHTAGPWVARPEPVDANGNGRMSHWIDGGPGRQPIADVRSYGDGESTANAQLIAAAPDLLKALQRSIQNIEQLAETANTIAIRFGLGKKVHADDFTESARAAIAKVRGESW